MVADVSIDTGNPFMYCSAHTHGARILQDVSCDMSAGGIPGAFPLHSNCVDSEFCVPLNAGYHRMQQKMYSAFFCFCFSQTHFLSFHRVDGVAVVSFTASDDAYLIVPSAPFFVIMHPR